MDGSNLLDNRGLRFAFNSNRDIGGPTLFRIGSPPVPTHHSQLTHIYPNAPVEFMGLV